MRRVLVTIQNLAFWPLFFVVSAVFIPVGAVVVSVLNVLGSRRAAWRRIRRAISWYGWTILRCGWPFVRVKYRDFAPEQKKPPFIFICNHRSSSDPFLMACLPYECIQIVNVWPMKLPVLGLVAKIAGYISVKEVPVDEFYTRAGRFLEEGVCIISFPEGTRSAGPRMGAFSSSIFRLAMSCRATIVPLAVSGNEDIPRKGSLVLHPGRIYVDKLPAVPFEEYREMTVFQLKSHVRGRLREHLDRIEGRAA